MPCYYEPVSKQKKLKLTKQTYSFLRKRLKINSLKLQPASAMLCRNVQAQKKEKRRMREWNLFSIRKMSENNLLARLRLRLHRKTHPSCYTKKRKLFD